ncbi:MAG: Hsp20/alpha crystallin family protein [Bacteroidetes bacterium]|nr:Hsp20/alpha crystallin family protein [Bacteroidota bacterium]
MKRIAGFGLPLFWEDAWDADGLTSLTFFGTERSLPDANIEEKDDEFMIELVIPDMKKKHFYIRVQGNNLPISSSRKEEKKDEDKNGNLRRREFKDESFSRLFALPESVDENRIEAKYDEGILNLTLQKKEAAKIIEIVLKKRAGITGLIN